ncbi:MAG: hypothetical protein IIU08_00425 [Clostridia bacterium]|nr:hypothetical protein [Clostridia bacterium]
MKERMKIMPKGILAAAAVFCLVLAALAGCVRKIPDKPAEAALGETVCGAYRSVRGDQNEITEIRMIGDFLIAETDEYDEEGHEMAWYAEEILPDDPDVLRDPASAARNGGIPVTVRRYSSFSNAGEYWDEPDRYRMELTDEGLWFRAENGGEDYLRVPDPTVPEPGGIAEKITELGQYYGAGTLDRSLVGGWKGESNGESVTIVFREDGGFASVSRSSKEHPAQAVLGAWTVSEEGNLMLLFRRIGWVGQPFDRALRIDFGEDGTLNLHEIDSSAVWTLSPAEIELRGRW